VNRIDMPRGSCGKDTRLSSDVMVGSNPTRGTIAGLVELADTASSKGADLRVVRVRVSGSVLIIAGWSSQVAR
jgi:hypothetical protein